MAYVTTAEVKAQLSITKDDYDSIIDALVQAAQAAVDEYTSQTWESPASASKYHVVQTFSTCLDIARAQSVTEVAEKNDGTWSALDSDLWETLESDGPAEQLIRTSGYWKRSRRGEASVRVTGVFATTAAAPPDIKQATLILAARLYQRRNAPLGLTAGGVETAAMHLARVDPDVHTLLKPRKELAVG